MSRHKRSTGVIKPAAPNKIPVIVITHGPEKKDPPGGGVGGGSLLAEQKNKAHTLAEKMRAESEALAKATVKASSEALKKSQAASAAKAKADAEALQKRTEAAKALTEKLKKDSDERLKKIREHDAQLEAERKQREEIRKQQAEMASQAIAAEKAKEEQDEMKDAVKFSTDFFKELTEKFSEKAAGLARELATSVKGKKLRSADEALQAFTKYKDVFDKKFSVQDREAIKKALDSVDKDQLAKNFSKFSKAFGFISSVIDVYDVLVELRKAISSNEWRPFFVKIETIFAGKAAAAVTAFAFSLILGAPLGIVGFALIIAIAGSLFDDELIEKINAELGV